MRALVVSSVGFYRDGIAAALRADGIDTSVLDHGDRNLGPSAVAADVVLVDLVDDDLAPSLEAVVGKAPVVGLAVTRDPPLAAAAALGVRAFVGCDQSVADLVLTTRRAARGEAVCPPSIACVLFNALGSINASHPPTPLGILTKREREIGRLVMRGLTNREIAKELVIEPATVKNHVHQILRKLNVGRRGQAADLLHTIWTERSTSNPQTAQTAVANL
jgi:two-component system, NarL family, nitrate/nitrite response regulator NarL